jgi:hypothetical protein
MAFITIYVPDGLSEKQYRQALRSGPSEVSSNRRAHEEMLAAAGFQEVEETDLTEEFAHRTPGTRDASGTWTSCEPLRARQRSRSAGTIRGYSSKLWKRGSFADRCLFAPSSQ